MAANLQFRATNWAQTTCLSRRRCIPASLHSVVAPMPKAWACRAVALRAQSAATSDAHLGSSSGSTTLSQLEIIGIAIAAAAPAVMLAAGPAAAADVIDDGGLDAVDALDASYGALQAQSGGSTDLLVSILAAIVFVLLVVVTGGVRCCCCATLCCHRVLLQFHLSSPLLCNGNWWVCWGARLPLPTQSVGSRSTPHNMGPTPTCCPGAAGSISDTQVVAG